MNDDIYITKNHKKSKNGWPVFIDINNNIVKTPEAIRLIKKKLNVNNKKLGDMLGVSSHTVESWTRDNGEGKREPSKSVMLLIYNIFN